MLNMYKNVLKYAVDRVLDPTTPEDALVYWMKRWAFCRRRIVQRIMQASEQDSACATQDEVEYDSA
jgi:hypothetical protein